MARTVDFYQGVLGMPLIKTINVPGGWGDLGEGQHFFFDIGNGDALAFFWYPRSVPAEPPHNLDPIGETTDRGVMAHVAFRVDPDKFDHYRKMLEEKGIEYIYTAHDLDDTVRTDPSLPNNDDTYALSVYFRDPDGFMLEFAAWLPAWDRLGVTHVPGGREAVVG
jgi:catechol 2,3-dioxygenase-like lactoylglutathione lyase family enzyme